MPFICQYLPFPPSCHPPRATIFLLPTRAIAKLCAPAPASRQLLIPFRSPLSPSTPLPPPLIHKFTSLPICSYQIWRVGPSIHPVSSSPSFPSPSLPFIYFIFPQFLHIVPHTAELRLVFLWALQWQINCLGFGGKERERGKGGWTGAGWVPPIADRADLIARADLGKNNQWKLWRVVNAFLGLHFWRGKIGGKRKKKKR